MIVRLSTSPVTRVSLLETNSQVWSPYLVKDNYTNWGSSTSFYQKLEGLTLTYRERFKVELLEERRLRAVLTFAYKLLFGYTAVDTREYFTMCNNVTTRGQPFKLLLPRFTTDWRKFF